MRILTHVVYGKFTFNSRSSLWGRVGGCTSIKIDVCQLEKRGLKTKIVIANNHDDFPNCCMNLYLMLHMPMSVVKMC